MPLGYPKRVPCTVQLMTSHKCICMYVCTYVRTYITCTNVHMYKDVPLGYPKRVPCTVQLMTSHKCICMYVSMYVRTYITCTNVHTYVVHGMKYTDNMQYVYACMYILYACTYRPLPRPATKNLKENSKNTPQSILILYQRVVPEK